MGQLLFGYSPIFDWSHWPQNFVWTLFHLLRIVSLKLVLVAPILKYLPKLFLTLQVF